MLTDRGRPGIDPAGVDGVLVSSASAVAWTAILGGALTASAVTLALLIFGSGIGIAVYSLGQGVDHSLTTISVVTIIWLIIVQWISSGLGGYIAGRLRTKWVGIHTDEVFFRDTAHGFLAWSLATLFSATIAISVASSAAKFGTYTIGMAGAGGAAMMSTQRPAPNGPASETADPLAYFIDGMYRSATPNANISEPEIRAQTLRILINGEKNGQIPPEDKAYLTQLVSARTGLSQPDAEKRVDDSLQQIDQAKAKFHEKEKEAQKAGATLSIFTFLSMLIGAFIASVSAALGGRRRDEY